MNRNCLGKLLEACKSYNVNIVDASTVPCYFAGTKPIKVGHFVFGSNSHDTGISVTVKILHPETGHVFDVVSGTYWYNEGQYGFNKFTWLKGKWDNALKDAIRSLKVSLLQAQHEDAIEEDAIIDKRRSEEAQTKESFEAIF